MISRLETFSNSFVPSLSLVASPQSESAARSSQVTLSIRVLSRPSAVDRGPVGDGSFGRRGAFGQSRHVRCVGVRAEEFGSKNIERIQASHLYNYRFLMLQDVILLYLLSDSATYQLCTPPGAPWGSFFLGPSPIRFNLPAIQRVSPSRGGGFGPPLPPQSQAQGVSSGADMFPSTAEDLLHECSRAVYHFGLPVSHFIALRTDSCPSE